MISKAEERDIESDESPHTCGLNRLNLTWDTWKLLAYWDTFAFNFTYRPE